MAYLVLHKIEYTNYFNEALWEEIVKNNIEDSYIYKSKISNTW